ncbi:MAG: hypothetical protein ACD_74C00247G0002 [uncultured bacterium]|nr:MAG: hypothetical protein ACD_74C00247G0002 [uncultured bacterium]
MDELIEAAGGHVNHLFAAEGQELPGQGGGPVSGLVDDLYFLPGRIIFRQLQLQQLAVAEDDGEDVVEVVGNPSGQDADGFHFLGLDKLAFQHFLFRCRLLAFGDIGKTSPQTKGAARLNLDLGADMTDPADLPSLGDDPEFQGQFLACVILGMHMIEPSFQVFRVKERV